MRVVVTRPERAARRTAARLRALGHEPVLLPLASAVHDRKAALSALDEPHAALVFTSAEALAALGPAAGARRDTPVFCVGAATADAAARAGFHHLHVAEGTGLSLAALIVAHYRKAPPPAPLLYLAGNPRSPDLEERLRDAAIPFRTVECYRMEDVVHDEAATARLLTEPAPDAVLLHSRESALRFFRLAAVSRAPQRLARTRFLCLSARTAAAVPEAFADATMIAASPDEASLLALLDALPPQI